MSTLSLIECFGYAAGSHPGRVIALIGGGGKTSLMYALAREFAARGEKVITTTTTKIFPPNEDQAPHLLLTRDDPQLATLDRALAEFGHVVLGKFIIESNGKIEGIGDDVLEICLRNANRIIIEADGAAGRPVKAPEEWEPVIPTMTDLVIPVIGLDCLGKPATDQWVFRLKRFLDVTGLEQSEPITPAALASLLAHPAGSLKGVGADSNIIPFLNKEDVLEDKSAVEEIALGLKRDSGNRIELLVHGSLRESKWDRTELV
jgi:probable selenium-dependent hydroxylase accessory protein YqeC